MDSWIFSVPPTPTISYSFCWAVLQEVCLFLSTWLDRFSFRRVYLSQTWRMPHCQPLAMDGIAGTIYILFYGVWGNCETQTGGGPSRYSSMVTPERRALVKLVICAYFLTWLVLALRDMWFLSQNCRNWGLAINDIIWSEEAFTSALRIGLNFQ